MSPLAFVGAVGVALGIVLVWSSFWEPQPVVAVGPSWRPPHVAWIAAWQLPAGLVAGGAVAALSGWLSLGVAAAVGIIVGPGLATSSQSEVGFADRTEAVAGWVETLRDTMRGSRGVEAALRVTAANAPLAVRPALERMNRRTSMGVPLDAAMADCADEIENPVFDLIAAVLLNAMSMSAAQLPLMLDDIAAQARERAHSHLQVHTSRSRQRTQLRLVGLVVLATIVGFATLFASYLAPLGTPIGQVVLSVAVLAVGALLGWIAQLSVLPQRERILDPRRALTLGSYR